MTAPTPGRVLGLAIVAWGLGHFSMGHSRAAVGWLLTEAVMLALVVVATVLFADTSWYLLPFLLGTAFIVTWAIQAVLAYRRAQWLQGAVAPAGRRSPAARIAWLSLPLLAWGTGFWLIGASAATPAAIVDRFVTGWPDADAGAERFVELSEDPQMLEAASRAATADLARLCSAGQLAADCDLAPENLLRDVRVRLIAQDEDGALALAERVRYERRSTRILGIFDGSELVPVRIGSVLRLELEARDAALGAVRWTIVNAEAD